MLFGCCVFLVASHVLALPFAPGIEGQIADAGYIDATRYDGVDPTGNSDSTAGLQQAIDDGMNYAMAVYLPSGTYVISDALRGDQDLTHNIGFTPASIYGIERMAGLIGDHSSRPRIVLQDYSPGFDNPNEPKGIIAFRNIAVSGWMGKTDIGFGQVIRNIEVVVGNGNPGAVGIQNPSAQWSNVQDVRVDATGGYAGLRGAVTTNVMVNIEVVGGRYGVIADACCGISYVGLTLRGQTEAGIWVTTWPSVTVSGFDITPAGGVALKIDPYASPLTMFDGVIDAVAATVLDKADGSGLYLSNTYVRDSDGGWQHIIERATPDFLYDQSISLVDGELSQDERLDQEAVDSPAEGLIALHAWNNVPAFNDAGVANAHDYGAHGDGEHDDTDALQAAIDASEVVFIPRGDYLTSRPLVLHGDTKLFGVSMFTRLFPKWDPQGEPAYAITTDEAPDGDAYLGDILIWTPTGDAYQWIAGVDWRIGPRSIVNEVHVDPFWEDVDETAGKAAYRVRDGGGGRFYGVTSFALWRKSNSDYRDFLVENTVGPTTLYGPNFEHARANTTIEVRSSANFRLLGSKSEDRRFAYFDASHNIVFAGFYTNNSSENPDQPLLVFNNCDNVLAADITPIPGREPHGSPTLQENFNGDIFAVDQELNCSVFRRGGVDFTAFGASATSVPEGESPDTPPSEGDDGNTDGTHDDGNSASDESGDNASGLETQNVGDCSAGGAPSLMLLAALVRIGHAVASRGAKAGRRSRRLGGKRDVPPGVRTWLVFVIVVSSSSAAAAAQSVEVARYRDNARAACSLTFDDALREDVQVVGPILHDVGINATFFVVIEWLEQTSYGTAMPWDAWRVLSDQGNEIGSHTMTHPSLPNVSAEELAYEVIDSHDAIEREIGTKHQTFAFPGSNFDDATVAFVEQHYVDWRDWHRQRWTDASTTTASTLDDVRESGEWLVPIIHAVDDEGGYDNIASSNLRTFAELLHADTDVWTDTFGTVARYVKERDAVDIGEIEVSATAVRFTPTHGLDTEVFDVPLTFVIHGLAQSDELHASQGTTVLPIRRLSSGDVLADATPGMGTVTVSTIAQQDDEQEQPPPIDQTSETPETSETPTEALSEPADTTMTSTKVGSSCNATNEDMCALLALAVVLRRQRVEAAPRV